MANYGIISICLFFTVFITAVVLSLRMNRQFLKRMESLPLDSDEPSTHPVLTPGTKGDLRHE